MRVDACGGMIRDDGTRWALPLGDLEWRLRYAPTREAQLAAASVVAAFNDFIWRPREEQAALVRDLRAALKMAVGSAPRPEPTP